MFTVFIEGLEFYAYHGVPAEERMIGHRYRVDLSFEVDSSTPESDEIETSVDYGQAALGVVATATTRQYRTVEKLARVLADELLSQYPRIQSLTIRLAKLLPPAPIIAQAVGVEMTFRRSDYNKNLDT